MKYSEIKNLEVQELRKRLTQTRQALFDARMKHKMQRLSNMMELRNYRKDIARLQTTLSALPESAFIFEKKKAPELEKDKSEIKKVKKTKAEKKSVAQKSTEPVKEKKLSTDKTQKVSADEKKEIKKPVTDKQKEIKSKLPEKQEKKEKKWFNFLGSKKAGKDMKSTGKRSLFRRKSGG